MEDTDFNESGLAGSGGRASPRGLSNNAMATNVETDWLIWHVSPEERAGSRPGVHLWCCDLGDAAWDRFCDESTLGESELAHAQRLRFERGRRLFLRRRALGRFLLGQFLGVPPQSLQFGQSEREEPILISPGADACRFNSSHAESVFAMAISTGAAAVGVDVETMRLDWDWEGVTEMYLDPGRLAQLRAVSQSERQETFLRFWSLREAFAKATGEGIVYESEDGVKSEQVWDLLFHPARLADEVAAAGWRWQTRRLHIGDKDAVVAAVRRGA